MKIAFYLSFIFIMSIEVFGVESVSQILVTKTTNKNYLSSINTKLQAMHLKMFIKKVDREYFIYTDKYSAKSINIVLKKVRREFPSAFIVSSYKESNTKSFFISLGGGYGEIQGSGVSYSLDAGYYFNESFLVALSYNNIETDDLVVNNYYLSTKYNYNFLGSSSLFLGVEAGYSTLELQNYDNSSASSSTLVGFVAGYGYAIGESISLEFSYQKKYFDHNVLLGEGLSTLKFDGVDTIELALKYSF
jgi:hypothetical protein